MSAASRSGESSPQTSFEKNSAYLNTPSRETRLNLPSIRTLQLDTPLPGAVHEQAPTSAPDMPWPSPLEFALPPLERTRSSSDEITNQSRTSFEQHPGMRALPEGERMDQLRYTRSDTIDAHLDVSTQGAARLPLTPESARPKERYSYLNDLGYHVPARSVTGWGISEIEASPQRTPPMSVHGSAVPRVPTPVLSGQLRHGPYPAPLSTPMSTRQMTEPIPRPLDEGASATSLEDAATLLFFKKEGVRHQRLIPRVRSLPHLKRELPGQEPHAVEAVRSQSRHSYTSSDDSSAYGTASQDDVSDFRSPAGLSSLLLNRRRRRRPPSTFGNYTNLIAHAILDSPNKRLTLKGLYVELPKRWPDLFNEGKGDKGWQNTVRNTLSTNSCFIRHPRISGESQDAPGNNDGGMDEQSSAALQSGSMSHLGRGGHWGVSEAGVEQLRVSGTIENERHSRERYREGSRSGRSTRSRNSPAPSRSRMEVVMAD